MKPRLSTDPCRDLTTLGATLSSFLGRELICSFFAESAVDLLGVGQAEVVRETAIGLSLDMRDE
jgi:hypothetical protein